MVAFDGSYGVRVTPVIRFVTFLYSDRRTRMTGSGTNGPWGQVWRAGARSYGEDERLFGRFIR